jgi:hypothetical protein
VNRVALILEMHGPEPSSFQRNEEERVRARLKDRGDPVTREGVGTEFKTVSLAKKPVLQPNNNALRCLRKLAR